MVLASVLLVVLTFGHFWTTVESYPATHKITENGPVLQTETRVPHFSANRRKKRSLDGVLSYILQSVYALTTYPMPYPSLYGHGYGHRLLYPLLNKLGGGLGGFGGGIGGIGGGGYGHYGGYGGGGYGRYGQYGLNPGAYSTFYASRGYGFHK